MDLEATESAQLIIWRQDGCRCELWVINGIGALRVYRGDELLHQEPCLTGRIKPQADSLRRFVATGANQLTDHVTSDASLYRRR